MGHASCPKCKLEYFVKGEVMFHKPIFYFYCENCDKLFAELPDGEWEEHEIFHEWLAKRNSRYKTNYDYEYRLIY